MSVHVISWVLKHSEAKLGARLALLVLADHAKDDGSCAWPSVETIAVEARLSRRAARDALRRLEGDDEIVKTGVSRAGTSIYTVLMGGEANSAGGKLTTGSVSSSSSEPSVNRPEEPSSSEEVKKSAAVSLNEPDGFAEWLGFHAELTDQSVPRSGTKERAKLASKFATLAKEGRQLEDFKLASRGAHADEFRRSNGYDFPKNILVFENFGRLVELGRRAEETAAAQDAQDDKWAAAERLNAKLVAERYGGEAA